MKIIAALSGILIPVSAIAATGLMENNNGLCVFMFLGYCALIVSAQLIPAVFLFIGMVKVIVSVISESFAIQKN